MADPTPYTQLKMSLQDLKLRDLTKQTVPQNNRYELEWETPLAIQRVNEMMYSTKIDGVVMVKTKGGFVIMSGPYGRLDGKYHEWRINDHAILHTNPSFHADFFWMTARMYIPASARSIQFNKISTSIVMDYRSHLVTAGCHFRGAGVATLSIVKEVMENRMTLWEAIAAYSSRINELLKEMEEQRVSSDPTPLTDAYELYVLS